MNDLIYRQEAIDAIGEKPFAGTADEYDYEQGLQNQWERDVVAIKILPPAYPEIVRCVDCVHSDTFPKGADNDMPLKCLGIRYGGVMPDWYCEHAERRTDG